MRSAIRINFLVFVLTPSAQFVQLLKRVSLAAVVAFGLAVVGGMPAFAQESGTVEGIVKDPTGAAVSGATVTIYNPVSHYNQSTTSNSAGAFRFTNVPFNPYHMTVTA